MFVLYVQQLAFAVYCACTMGVFSKHWGDKMLLSHLSTRLEQYTGCKQSGAYVFHNTTGYQACRKKDMNQGH